MKIWWTSHLSKHEHHRLYPWWWTSHLTVMLHRRVSVPRPSVWTLSWACGPAHRHAPLATAYTVYQKKREIFPFASTAAFPTPTPRPPWLLLLLCHAAPLLLLLFHAPAPPLLTLLLLLFRASARLLLLLLRCLPRPTTPTGVASARRSVGPRCGSPPASPPAMAVTRRAPMQTAEEATRGYDACCKCYNSNVSVEVCCK